MSKTPVPDGFGDAHPITPAVKGMNRAVYPFSFPCLPRRESSALVVHYRQHIILVGGRCPWRYKTAPPPAQGS
ncbi:MAG TPA: hypothetical protein PKW05_06120 [Anaerolineae bacterium]|nr:hypothetical protein [Anaerolineae bacterium]HQJ51336.1 hypothetical protein [Anaerolineae bacterium]